MSAALKLKPTNLGQPKIKLSVVDADYSHERQANLDQPGQIYMTTFNATQTFDSKGRPADKDNDK